MPQSVAFGVYAVFVGLVTDFAGFLIKSNIKLHENFDFFFLFWASMVFVDILFYDRRQCAKNGWFSCCQWDKVSRVIRPFTG